MTGILNYLSSGLFSNIVSGSSEDITIKSSVRHNKDKGEYNVNLMLEPLLTTTQPVELMLILDTSGSMGDESMKNTDDTGKETGFSFSRRDLLCHASKAVCEMLDDSHKLGIIEYNSEPKTLFPLTTMDSNGKHIAIEKINRLHASGGTEIGKAIRHCFNEFKKASKNASKHIMLLTDGEPSDDKIRIIQDLKNEMEKSDITFSTFIFGYNADSTLFSNMANIGHGMYSFIPDCSMIGTVFSNYIANITNTQVKELTIELINTNGCELANIEQQKITLYNLHRDQTRNVLYSFKINSVDPVFMTFKVVSNFTKVHNLEIIRNIDIDAETVAVEECRSMFIKYLKEITTQSNLTNQQRGLVELLSIFKSYKDIYPENNKINCMIRDFESTNVDEGQLTKSFSRADWYNKWGKHYALSVLRAHELEETTNYKTPSVSYYGGQSFIKIRDNSDIIFTTLPTPEPSIKPMVRYNGTSSYNPAPQYVPMSQDNLARNFYGGCLDRECPVDVIGGKKYINTIVAGDIVVHSKGTSRVKCLVQHNTNGENTEYAVLCSNSEPDVLPLKITKWHPVKRNGIFGGEPAFPNDLVEFTTLPTTNYFAVETPEYVYNIVMEEGDYPWFTVNGYECVALGHKNTVNTVLAHDYYAEKVIDDLKQMPGWENGFVSISNKKIRDPNTKMVIGLHK